jgi:hypothetical protein
MGGGGQGRRAGRAGRQAGANDTSAISGSGVERTNNIGANPLAYTAGYETVWATDVLLLILAFCQ